ncbi:MAG: imidazole glycerol phosphate synthase subunit HisH [Oscillospiraceae bacterium]|nr:imidazole glycerol phosphate synthase subunit HisH [Oscillospiraceae bacterium]
MTAVVDYGVGNLFSLCSSLRAVGVEAVVTRERAAIRAADRLILPGVGAFGDAADKLRALGLDGALIEEAAAGKPVLGICLGMQLLFERGFEYGEHRGLGLIEGSVAPMAGSLPPGLKIPQMGWNALEITRAHPLLKYISSGDCVYFVHSYRAADCAGSVIATAEYGLPVTAAVAKGNVMGCQFHPEKSGRVGLGILRAFCEMGAAG